MTTINSLDVLAARVEAATGPDRELDCAIAVAAMGFFECEPRWPGGPIGYGYIDEDGARVEPGHGGDQLVKRFTASLDAAMTLVSARWRILTINEQDIDDEKPWVVRLVERNAEFGRAKTVDAIAVTASLAMTAAALRSHLEKQ
jgi:hypothetical protein